MTTTILRSRRLAAIACLIFLIGVTTRAQEKTPIPSYTGERVIVKDVPDRYGALADQITRLEKASPQSYYVVVVKSTGQGSSATRDYANELYDTWKTEGASRGHSFDPERSVVVVVALDNRQVAVKTGTTLQNQFGLHADRVETELIPAFIDLATESRYPEAISSLLDTTNNWIAAHDSATAYVPIQVSASKTAVSPAKSAKSASKVPVVWPQPAVVQPTGTDRSVVQERPEPLKRARSDWLPVIILGVPVLLLVLAILAGVWLAFRRSQGRVAARIKEIKSKAVDVMDRLDSLKERIKLMPTSTDFQQPLTGETKALYNAVDDRLGKLWDGWLHVMEVLDKAQKLAARSGSPLSQKTLSEAEELINKQGSFDEIEKQAKTISADVDKLDHAHQVARLVLESVTGTRPKIDGLLEDIKKFGLPDCPLRGRAGCLGRRDDRGQDGTPRRSSGHHDGPGTAPVAVGCRPGPDRQRRCYLW